MISHLQLYRGSNIGILSFIFGSKKNQNKKSDDHATVFENNPSIEEAKNIELLPQDSDGIVYTEDDVKLGSWEINPVGANIVSPLTSQVIIAKKQELSSPNNRTENDRRLDNERRLETKDRRQKKSWRLFDRRKNKWDRRSKTDRRFAERRNENNPDTNMNNTHRTVADDIERFEIRPSTDKHGDTKLNKMSSPGIISSMVDIDNDDNRMSLGKNEIFAGGMLSFTDDYDKTEILLKEGEKIGYYYQRIIDGEGNKTSSFIEIGDSGISDIMLRYSSDNKIILKAAEESIQLNLDLHDNTLNIITDNALTILLDDTTSMHIKIASHKTFG